MSTPIDTLKIQIESSSASAEQGIRGLADALGELKKNGTITTAVKNLNSLRDSLRLFNNIPSNASKVLSLASSLERLKQVGSVASIGNSVKKLADGMKALSTISVDKGKIDSVASALSSLSNVKAGGINTMMNGLMKLDKVTESLSTETIDAFAKKIDYLSDKLTPLSQKMTTIQSGLKGINSAARSAGGGAQSMGDGLNTASVNLSSFIHIVQTAVQALQVLIQKFMEFMAQAIEWDGIHHQFGNAFGEQADLYYEKITEITEALNINKQAFMEYSAMSASMLIGFGVNEADAREMGLGYTELAYDIWAAFNNVYKTMDGADGAMAAVRSAIAGEVEPIRRAGFTIVDTQLAMTAANHGLEYSTQNATEAQKSYLRYLTLVDQAQSKGIIGTYASEMSKAEGMVRTFTQQLKTLSQSFGSLFIPVLVKVMPYIQAFVELLTDAVRWVAALFGIKIQAVDFSGYSKGADAVKQMGDSADGAQKSLGGAAKAAKELKNATLGIDELNVISPPSASGGGGGGGLGGLGAGYDDLGISSIWDQGILDSVESRVDEIKEKIKGWLPVIGAVAAALAGLSLLKFIGQVKTVGAMLGIGAAGGGAFAAIKEFFAAAKQMAPEVGWIAALFPKLSVWFTSIGTAISGAATAVGTFLAGITAPVWATIAAIVAAVASAAYFLYQNWDEVVNAVKRFFAENIAPKLEEIKGHFDKIAEALSPVLDALQPVVDWFKELFKSIADFFKNIDFESILQGIGKAIEWIGGVVFSVFGSVVAGAFQAAVSIIESFVQTISGIVQIVSGVVKAVVNLFTLDFRGAWDAVKEIGAGIVDVFKGLWGMIFSPIKEFVDGVIDFFVDLWDELVGHSIVPDTIDGIVKCFKDLPGKVFKAIGNFFSDLVKKFKGFWSDLTKWWNSKTALKTYTPSIGSIYEKLKDRWDNAKEWWNNKKTKLKEYTPSIGSIYEKVYDRWTNARDWWNNKKAAMKSYTPTIGSILDKLKSAWNTAKTWWNKNVKLSIPSLSFKVTYSNSGLNAIQKAVVKALGLSGWPKLSFAANGGIFDTGSLIWAGERGPEVMATAAGGKTGVMNVAQMQDAVYEGVYAAVVAAMRATGGNGGSQGVNVYLDGRQITSAVEQRQRERGASIMGNQVYSYG